MNGKLWTPEEDLIIKTNYSYAQYSQLLNQLIDRSKGAIQQRARLLGITRDERCRRWPYIQTKYNVDRNFFSEPILLNCYWAGFIAADGGIDTSHHRVYIKLSNIDHQHLIQFARDVQFSGPIKEYWEITNKGNNHFSKIVIDSVYQWIEDLDKYFNIKQGKTISLLGPNLDINSDLALAYIAGLIDGDGSIVISDAKVKGNYYRRLNIFITGTKEILTWVNNILLFQFPIHTTRINNLEELKNTSTVQRFSFGGIRALTIVNKIRTLNLPLLNRKWDKINNLSLGRI